MSKRVVSVSGPHVGRDVGEMRQPVRAFYVWLGRRMLKRSAPEGLLGLDRHGRPLWMPGYPKDDNVGG